GNSFIFQGKAAFNAYAEHLHSLGPLVPVAELFLLIVFFIHIALGISLFLKNRVAAGKRYAVKSSAGGETWGSRTMPWTGLTILAFLFLHLFNVRFVDQTLPIADVVDKVLANPLYTLFYLFGIAALTLHSSHGFWSLLQTWGVHHSRYNTFMRGGACALMAFISMIFLGVVVVFW
ncbi:MAG: succinate dehydrogenase, partial [Candidatus Electrothrix sp. ATG2]|nr:succinate dehydrogenase [Candidatus Electrothrix sp. ATG2]